VAAQSLEHFRKFRPQRHSIILKPSAAPPFCPSCSILGPKPASRLTWRGCWAHSSSAVSSRNHPAPILTWYRTQAQEN
jgi:hypothetical protein